MRAIIIGAAALMLLSGGCMWPAATYVHGTAKVTRPGMRLASSSPGSKPAGPARMIVVKYWSAQQLFNSDKKKFEFVGSMVAEKEDFCVSFPIRFYPAGWTPALGTQHLLPDAGLIIFAEGYWPTHVVADDGRRCCEAPSTGQRHWDVVLEPMGRAPACLPPARGWDAGEFPPLTPDELDGLLKWNWSVTKADRQMCHSQLERLLDCWRKNPAPAS